jgi:hypothetical protein
LYDCTNKCHPNSNPNSNFDDVQTKVIIILLYSSNQLCHFVQCGNLLQAVLNIGSVKPIAGSGNLDVSKWAQGHLAGHLEVLLSMPMKMCAPGMRRLARKLQRMTSNWDVLKYAYDHGCL